MGGDVWSRWSPPTPYITIRPASGIYYVILYSILYIYITIHVTVHRIPHYTLHLMGGTYYITYIYVIFTMFLQIVQTALPQALPHISKLHHPTPPSSACFMAAPACLCLTKPCPPSPPPSPTIITLATRQWPAQ